MIKKVLIGLTLVIVLFLLCLHVIGKGWLGEPWSSAPVAEGPRPMSGQGAEALLPESRILFGDLHNHTNYSIDAYVFNSKLVKGGGITTPADACDFARYCSALDFWSINDHAEGLTPGCGPIRSMLSVIVMPMLVAETIPTWSLSSVGNGPTVVKTLTRPVTTATRM